LAFLMRTLSKVPTFQPPNTMSARKFVSEQTE
jgi:hypothetical protein